MARNRKPPSVEVEWIDAINYNHFHGTIPDMVARAKLLYRRHTQGYLIHTDGEEVQAPELRRLVIAHDYDPPQEPGEEPLAGNITVIPLGWVVAIRQKDRKRTKREGPAEQQSALQD